MEEIELLGRKLEREQAARAQAESILEKKSLELYAANEALRQLNERLETTIQERTADLDRIAKQYRQIVENVSDLIYRADAIGTITYINQVAFVKFGYTEAEVIGKRFTAFIHPDFRTKVIKFYQEVFQKGQPQSYFEFPILDKWGKTVWLGQNVQLLKKGEQIDQVFAVARDITARKAAEIELSHAQRRLRESEEKYRGIMENMELGLLEVDVEQNILRAYDSFCEMTGYTSDELIGQNAEEIFIVPAFKSVIQAEDRDRRTGKSSVYEVQIKHKNGRPIWVLISGAPIYDSAGKMVGSIGIHYDITNRKMLEEELRQAKEVAEEARAAEQQFLARMSHEIRTPLNAIVGMTHLLYDTQPSSEQQEYLTVLKRSADILTGLISDILDFSKIQAGEMKVVKQPLDLPGLVQSMRKTFSLQFENRPVAVRANIDQRITNLLLGDELLLSQVLL
ncbi:MAG: PAS domain S-box protein, partial [Bacteroidota bacterium]